MGTPPSAAFDFANTNVTSLRAALCHSVALPKCYSQRSLLIYLPSFLIVYVGYRVFSSVTIILTVLEVALGHILRETVISYSPDTVMSKSLFSGNTSVT